MTRVYIVRHAEAEGNLYRRVHGWYDSLITDNGRRQIAALANRFQDIRVDAVYSSNLYRTMTTAGAVYKPKGLTLHTRPDLREISVGVWEDRTWGELARRDGERLRLFNGMSPDFSVEGGETFAQVQDRMLKALLDIAAAHPGQTVAVFSHGSAIRCLQGAVRGLVPGQLDGLGHSDNTAVTCLEVEGDRVSVVFENDNSHLPEEISTLARQSWWKSREGGTRDANMWFRPMDLSGKDAEFYYEARREAWLDIHGPDIPFDGDGFLADARENLRANPGAVVCAMLGEEQAGVLQLNPVRDARMGAGYIPFVYMTPTRRKQGLGVQLIGQAVSFYRPMGRTLLRLRCAPDNGVAQRFYKKYGFYKIGEAEGARVPLDLLEKRIGYDDET